MEKWKDIKGYEGAYQISNFGRLKSFKKYPNGQILSTVNQYGWYFAVSLRSENRKGTTKRIHRLVAKAFIPNPKNKKEVNHIDGDKQNNKVENLEWVTHKENYWHSRRNGLSSHKEMVYYNQKIRPKQIMQIDMNNNLIAIFANSKIAGDATGVCSRNILQVAAKTEYKPGLTRKQAGGFIWKFKA